MSFSASSNERCIGAIAAIARAEQKPTSFAGPANLAQCICTTMCMATTCHGKLKTLFFILFTRYMYFNLDRHFNEPEVYAIYPQQFVIGCACLDSRFPGLVALMLRNLHNGYVLCNSLVIE